MNHFVHARADVTTVSTSFLRLFFAVWVYKDKNKRMQTLPPPLRDPKGRPRGKLTDGKCCSRESRGSIIGEVILYTKSEEERKKIEVREGERRRER